MSDPYIAYGMKVLRGSIRYIREIMKGMDLSYDDLCIVDRVLCEAIKDFSNSTGEVDENMSGKARS